MRFLTAAALIVALAPLPVMAQEMQPGMWEMTTSTEMPGMPAMKQSAKHCMTKEQLADRSTVTNPMGDSGCKMLEQSQSGNQFKFKMSCTEGQTMSGTVTYDKTGYKADNLIEMKEDGEVTRIKSSVVAKRVGDCK